MSDQLRWLSSGTIDLHVLTKSEHMSHQCEPGLRENTVLLLQITLLKPFLQENCIIYWLYIIIYNKVRWQCQGHFIVHSHMCTNKLRSDAHKVHTIYETRNISPVALTTSLEPPIPVGVAIMTCGTSFPKGSDKRLVSK